MWVSSSSHPCAWGFLCDSKDKNSILAQANQYGVCCSGCQVAPEEALKNTRVDENACALRKVYSHDEFLEHFRQCPKAQDLWRLSQQGKDTARISGVGGISTKGMLSCILTNDGDPSYVS